MESPDSHFENMSRSAEIGQAVLKGHRLIDSIARWANHAGVLLTG